MEIARQLNSHLTEEVFRDNEDLAAYIRVQGELLCLITCFMVFSVFLTSCVECL